MPSFHLASFRADVTPPAGHPLCGGWYPRPSEGITDPLEAIGIVILPANHPPVVLCAVDWCEMSHADHLLWRLKLAEATGTSAERVSVQCLHTHEAPWPDRVADNLVSHHDPSTHVMMLDFCDAALERVAQTARASLAGLRPGTHVGTSQARVEKVASNRRIMGSDGKVRAIRWTATKDPAVRAEPEGLVDPWLKTISFWDHDRKLASLHYYACHPNSYGGDGLVTKDFAGLARVKRQADEPDVTHIYFTACAGNISAGKYNDGAPENRAVLAGRIYEAIMASERKVDRFPIGKIECRVAPVLFPPREDFDEAVLLKNIADRNMAPIPRIKEAMKLAYLRQVRDGGATLLTALHFDDRVSIVNLPGEPFLEYQFFAQQQRPDAFVAAVGYGDCSVGYVPLAKSFAEGGYEPIDAFVSPKCEALMYEAIGKLLRSPQ